MKDLTHENTVEAAKQVKIINEAAFVLDVEYLTQCLDDMRQNHSMRESAAVLNPNPFTHHEQQDLNAAKLEQLSLMLKLAENSKKIINCQKELIKANGNARELNKLFGGI